MTTTRLVKVTFSIEGFHNWPGAPMPFGYLQSTHRHRFDFECIIQEGQSRDIEINHEAAELKWLISDGKSKPFGQDIDFGGRSCEDLAELTLEKIIQRWAPAHAVVWVLEDGIQGGGVIYDADSNA